MPITSLIGAGIGSSASSTAANDAASANTTAAGNITGATTAGQGLIQSGITQADTAIGAGETGANSDIQAGLAGANTDIANAGATQAGIYQNETGGLSPYQQAGNGGITNLSRMAGTFTAPTAAQAAATPGYQFQLQQGLKALNNNAATSGMLQSGANQKANLQYAEGLASTNYQNVYNNSLAAFNANQAGYQTLANLGTTANSQNLLAGSTYGNQLTSLAGLGTNANIAAAGLGTGVNMQGAALGANAALQGNEASAVLGVQGNEGAAPYTAAAGADLASGVLGSANAWTSALNQLGNLGSMGGGGTGGMGGGGGGSSSNPLSNFLNSLNSGYQPGSGDTGAPGYDSGSTSGNTPANPNDPTGGLVPPSNSGGDSGGGDSGGGDDGGGDEGGTQVGYVPGAANIPSWAQTAPGNNVNPNTGAFNPGAFNPNQYQTLANMRPGNLTQYATA
jgi:hypothetical protein